MKIFFFWIARQVDFTLAPIHIARMLPRLTGPTLNKMRRFPVLIEKDDEIENQIEKCQKLCKFTLRKRPVVELNVGHTGLSLTELVKL